MIYLFRNKYIPKLFQSGDEFLTGYSLPYPYDCRTLLKEIMDFNAHQYFCPGNAEKVGRFGHLGIFLHYVCWYPFDPSIDDWDEEVATAAERQHAFCPTALLGAVVAGQVELLDSLACQKQSNFDFHGLSLIPLLECELSLSSYHFPEELIGKDVFLFLLYGAFDSRMTTVIEWLMNWLLRFESYQVALAEFNFVLRLWYNEQFQDLLGTDSPISKFYDFTDFVVQAKSVFVRNK